MSSPMDINAPSVTLSVTSSTARAALNDKGSTIAIDVPGTTAVFAKTGDSTVVATITDKYIAPGMPQVFSKNPSHTHIAMITATGTATAYIQTGGGV